MNTCCSQENNILQHSTFNSTLKQATFIDNQREYCLYYPRVQCYQWHLLHPVFSICYFSSEFTILSNVSFETPCTNYKSHSLIRVGCDHNPEKGKSLHPRQWTFDLFHILPRSLVKWGVMNSSTEMLRGERVNT